MSQGPEQRLYTPIKTALRSRGAFCIKIHGGPQQPQAIDFFICYRGRFVGIEVKTPKDPAPTPAQAEILRLIDQAKGIARVVYSVRGALRILDEIDKELAHADR